MEKMHHFPVKKGIAGLLAGILLIFIDQWTKLLAVSHLMGQEDYIILDGVFELHYLENRGAAFGILQNQKILFVILTVLILAAIIYVYLYRIPQGKRYVTLNVIAVLFFSGALGNFIDRLAKSYVVDFFYFTLIDFPVFNVADIYVTVAAGLFLVLGLFYYKDEDYEKIFPSKKRNKGEKES